MIPVSSTRTTVARVTLATILLVFAADYLLAFMPVPPISAAGGAFLEALLATGYMFPLIKGVEVAGAALLLTRRTAPLGLVVLAPVITHIALYHAVLDPNGGWIAASLVALELFLVWSYRDAFRPLVGAADAAPAGAPLPQPVPSSPRVVVPAARS